MFKREGKGVLESAILHQGWSAFPRQVVHKQGWLGVLVVAVPPQHTSQRCPCYGNVEAANRLSQ